MTMSSEAQAVGSFLGLSLYRTCMATPLEGIAKREILGTMTTWKVIQTVPFSELGRGFQPNGLKFLSRTGAQVGGVAIASRLVPSQLDPGLRGAAIGILSTGIETGISNSWNVVATRFVQGEGWSVVRKEGPILFSKGLSLALFRRGISGLIFWGTYEKLHQTVSYHPVILGGAAGMVQACLTAPLYIGAVLQQGKNAPTERFPSLLTSIGRTQGYVRGLFLPGLAPRLTLSILSSGPLMGLFERYNVIQRST